MTGAELPICAECQAPFQRVQTQQRFCSRRCKNKHHNDKQIWELRPDRERKNIAKRTAYQADREAGAKKLRDWRAANPDRQKEIEQKYRDGHKPELKQRNSAWRAKNREYNLHTKKEWHAAHREQANAKRRQRHLDHLQEENNARKKMAQIARMTTPWKNLLHSAKGRAKVRNIPFSLTDEWAKERWTGRCEVSNLSFSLGGRASGPKVYSPSIDQIEAKKGYTPDNCRFVIWAVNALKHDGTNEDMYRVAEAIIANRPQKLEPLNP